MGLCLLGCTLAHCISIKVEQPFILMCLVFKVFGKWLWRSWAHWWKMCEQETSCKAETNYYAEWT